MDWTLVLNAASSLLDWIVYPFVLAFLYAVMR